MAQPACDKPVYLTIDTGHMGVANLVADVLKRQNVKATFFAANEKTQEGDGSLGGYGGDWYGGRAERLSIKRALLELEGVSIGPAGPAPP